MNQRRSVPAVLVLFACLAVQSVSLAQQSPLPPPLQPADTSSPAATLDSLIDACNVLYGLLKDGASEDDAAAERLATIERILDCLDLSELPLELRPTAGIESALYLKEVLDRIPLPASAEIPTFESSTESTNAPARWQIPQTRIAITRVNSPARGEAFLFSSETVRRAPEFYRMVKTLPYRAEGRQVSPGLRDAYVSAAKQQITPISDTSSPRGTLTLFIDSCNALHDTISQKQHIDRNDPEFVRLAGQIISCLDTSQLPEYTREYFDGEAAVCLKEILDRIPLPPAEQIPGPESVDSSDSGEPLGRWQIPRSQIVIARMPDGPRRGEYLFAAETVGRAPDLYDKVAGQPYQTAAEYPLSEGLYRWWLSVPAKPSVARLVDRLPGWCQRRVLGMAIWQAIGLTVITTLSLAVMFLLFAFGRRQGEQVRERSLLRYWLSFGWFAIAVFIPLPFKHFLWDYLTLRGSAFYIVNFCTDLVFLMGIVLLIIGISSRAADTLVALPQVAPKSLDANLIRILCRVLGIAAAVIVFLEGGRYLGFPVTTLLASAGIGGLAIALSAQGLIKGLFGTVTILLDKPYRVGERIMVKGHDGIVQEIGLRSTKIIAFTGNVISIPNDQIADAEIENIGKRRHIRRMTELCIPLDTPSHKVEAAIECIRTILSRHADSTPEFPPRVYFSEILPNAFAIKIVYWYSPPDYWKYMAFCEKINFEIFKAFEEREIAFSLPLRHTYWKDDDQKGPLEVELVKPSRPPSEP